MFLPSFIIKKECAAGVNGIAGSNQYWGKVIGKPKAVCIISSKMIMALQ